MAAMTVHEMAAHVAELMDTRLGVGGAGLPAKLSRGGRRVPRRIRREMAYLAHAAEQETVPKLRMQMNHARIAEAYAACIRYLEPIGADARRRAVLLDMMTGVGGAVFATFVLVLVVVVWRGLV